MQVSKTWHGSHNFNLLVEKSSSTKQITPVRRHERLGFWSRMRRAFFDVTAFSPFARSNRGQSLAKLFKENELRKNREYKQRILQVEHGDFNPLVFATSGGMGPQATAVVKRLGKHLAEKQNLEPSVVMGWLRCRLSFALLRSTLVLLRGSRPHRHKEEVIELAASEARIDCS